MKGDRAKKAYRFYRLVMRYPDRRYQWYVVRSDAVEAARVYRECDRVRRGGSERLEAGRRTGGRLTPFLSRYEPEST
jgi:hypothetical protein